MIPITLSKIAGGKDGEPRPAYIVEFTSVFVFLLFLIAWACALTRAFRVITDDLNRHFRGHASSLSFMFIRLDSGMRLVVGSETRADGSV